MELKHCPDCNAEPGQPHLENCDVERCSVCGGQRFGDDCKGHDKAFARWAGVWPGKLEAEGLGVDLNEFYTQGYNETFFVKPIGVEEEDDIATEKWVYRSQNIRGGLHDAVTWLNDNGNNYSVLAIESYPTKISELGFTEGLTTIVWRERVTEGTKDD